MPLTADSMQNIHEIPLNPEAIRVLSWNIQKQSRPQLSADLAGFCREIDLALLQEVHVEGNYLHHFHDGWHRSFAPGFSLPRRTTGVMTLSVSGHRQQDRFCHPEPILRTLKAANATTHALAGMDEPLLVVNLHAVNFSLGMQAYTRQLHDLLQCVDRHEGPVIFAGDFNAWHNMRKQLLDEIASHRGFVEVPFAVDHRMQIFGKPLDYMFIRDLKVLEARTLASRGSDHNPLLASLGL